MTDPILFVGLGVTAILSAILGVLLLASFPGPFAERRRWRFVETGDTAEFLFDGDLLVDATPAARGLLCLGSGRRIGAERAHLMQYLDRHFPGVADRFAMLHEEGPLMMAGADDMLLRAESRGGLIRITLSETGAPSAGMPGISLRHRQQEFDDLAAMVTQCPFPIWRQDASGQVVWANAAYLDLVAARLGPGDDILWPLPPLFGRLDPAADGAAQRRQLVPVADAPPVPVGQRGVEWYDIVLREQGGQQLLYAMPAEGAVQAEQSLRAFMQTLTKTFAHLPTGLAIFDHARRLAMFNPALVDLTGLPPDFLSARPSLIAFFDALRDRSMIPEPRDYRTWRARLTDLEQAAANGLYAEVWHLPGGQTYRVTGRPHPNGALALLVEDISSEVSQTRRYRADLELGQAVIDAMDKAIAVFSSAGVLVLSNAAYARLWDHDPAGGLGQEGQAGAVCDHWRSRSVPSALWDRAEDFIGTIQPRKAWTDRTWLRDGRALSCRFTPLAGSATLVAFGLGKAADSASATKDSALEENGSGAIPEQVDGAEGDAEDGDGAGRDGAGRDGIRRDGAEPDEAAREGPMTDRAEADGSGAVRVKGGAKGRRAGETAAPPAATAPKTKEIAANPAPAARKRHRA
ncbi:PAS-domain containing protein [Szabonella alba]|uniref:PAS-domain containing protein n=1 Tax=Szabonella alba TaxID=2804194 RepID=A0A8K0V6G1_9RHOB|nr:PAS-domain containing protein [Szabonella alba]MBL4916614.1 PAS-domain containing protein [Szabonella alba]